MVVGGLCSATLSLRHYPFLATFGPRSAMPRLIRSLPACSALSAGSDFLAPLPEEVRHLGRDRARSLPTSSSGASSSPVGNCGNSSVVTISPFSAFDPGQCQALERRHLSSKVRRATPCRQPHPGVCWLRDKIRFRESGSHLAELSRPQRLKYFARQQAWPPILQASLHARTIADSSHCAVQYLCYT